MKVLSLGIVAFAFAAMMVLGQGNQEAANLTKEGIEASKTKDWDKAITAFRKAAQLEQRYIPNLASALQQRATAYVSQKKFQEAIADYYETVASVSGGPRAAANWVMGDLSGALNAAGKDITSSPVSAANMGELVGLVCKKQISAKLAKEIFPKMFASGEAPRAIREREGLTQISDAGAHEKIIVEVIAGNPKQVEQYRAGKEGLLGYFVGQVMRETGGKADPKTVNGLLREKLRA